MPTTRERLAARLNTIIAALGIADARIEPDDVRRVHAGRHQRSEGAFSWFTQPRNLTGRLVSFGSQSTAADCVRLPVIVSPSFGECEIDPVFPEHRTHTVVPNGAAFGVADDLTLSGFGAVRWYDAAGVALPASAVKQDTREKNDGTM